MILLKILFGLFAPVVFTTILFFIHPLLGILSIIWFTLVEIYVLRRDLIMRLLARIFGKKQIQVLCNAFHTKT